MPSTQGVQFYTTTSTATQTITANTETVIATLAAVNSRSAGSSISLSGAALFVVQAATTITTARIRKDSLTGSVVGVAQPIGGTAASQTGADIAIGAVDSPSGEIAGQIYVLTIQATSAGANWNVTFAQLQAFV